MNDQPNQSNWTFSQSIADVDPQEWGGVLIESANDPA